MYIIHFIVCLFNHCSFALLTNGGLGAKGAPGSPGGGGGTPFWYGYPTGGSAGSPGCLGKPGGYGPMPGVGGFPLGAPFGAPGPPPGCPFGVGGLLPGVPGLSPALEGGPPSLGLSDGVDLEEEDRFDGGRSLLSDTDPLSPSRLPPSLPVLSRCSPFNAIGLGV